MFGFGWTFIEGFIEGLKETPGYLASFALLAGGAYLILFSASVALKRVGIILVIIGAVCLAHMTGYSRGASGARAECHEADLRAQLAAKNRDLSIQQATSAEAQSRATELQANAEELQQKVRDYEAELSKQPIRSACALTPADIDGLRRIDLGQSKTRNRNTR